MLVKDFEYTTRYKRYEKVVCPRKQKKTARFAKNQLTSLVRLTGKNGKRRARYSN